ncbi:MAG: BON domain-containing protein [Acidobacteriota bacterium]
MKTEAQAGLFDPVWPLSEMSPDAPISFGGVLTIGGYMKTQIRMLLLVLPVLGIHLLGEPALAASTVPPEGQRELMTERQPAQSQRRMEQEVRHELLMLPYYGVFDNLTFQVKDDRVILSGQTSRPSLKSAAERVVRNVEGVAGVVNHIEVLPVSSFDDRIRLAVYRAIYGQSALQRYQLQAVPPVHIIVKNGHVTLEGVVANEMDKNIATIQANAVPGVFSVKQNLVVEN